jgi:hypothetical protein
MLGPTQVEVPNIYVSYAENSLVEKTTKVFNGRVYK